MLATCADDASVTIWDTERGEELHRIAAHLGGVRSVAFDRTAELLATGCHDGKVGVWRVGSWKLLRTFGLVPRPGALRRRTSTALVEGVGRGGGGQRRNGSEPPTVTPFATAAGPSPRQQFWPLVELSAVRDDGAECEAVLWDLAGQPDYRLVHALFLDDADLGLLLFDPTRDDDPLRGVEYWVGQLGADTPTVLVAARSDRGSARLTAGEIEDFCHTKGIEGFHVTSAFTGEGLEPLVERIRSAIPWEAKPATVTTDTFKRIKDNVLAVREATNRKVILTPGELRAALERDPELAAFTDEQMLAVVGHLAHHGYVAHLRTSRAESRILLAPELVNNVAASIVLRARLDEGDVGSLDEQRVLTNAYDFRELADLAAEDRDVLLDSAVGMFLAHNVCLREIDPLSGRAYLVFPELINLKKPPAKAERPTAEGVSYRVTGAVGNVYASLVVLLGYTSTFTRVKQWRNDAHYVVGDDQLLCGFRAESEREGELQFVLYFDERVRERERRMFQDMFESLLARRELTVLRFDPVICSNGHRLNRSVVQDELASGNEAAFCTRCGERLQLAGALSRPRLTVQAVDALAPENRTADTRTRFEEVLFKLKAHVDQAGTAAPDCFISYAWGRTRPPLDRLGPTPRAPPDLQGRAGAVVRDRARAGVGSGGDVVHVVPAVDVHREHLAALDQLGVRLGAVDLHVEQEPARADDVVGVDDARGLLVERQLSGLEHGGAVGQRRAPPAELLRVEPRHHAAGAVRQPVGDDPRQPDVVAGILLEQQVAAAVDRHVVGLVEEGSLGAVEQQRQRAAQLRVLDVVEPQPPQAAAVAAEPARRDVGALAALGREEVEVAGVRRIPVAVLDAVQADPARLRLRVHGGAGGLVPVHRVQREARRDTLAVRGAERRVRGRAGHRRDGQRAVGQARAVDRRAVRLLRARVDPQLAVLAVLHPHHERRVAEVVRRHGVLPGREPQPRELGGLALRGDREAPAEVAVLLAREEQPARVAVAGARRCRAGRPRSACSSRSGRTGGRSPAPAPASRRR